MHKNEAPPPAGGQKHDAGPAHPRDGESLRDLVARWVMEREDMIRAIARRRLTGQTRAVFDSEDVFATVLKRMDELAARGVLRVDSARELTALLTQIVRNSAANKSRLIERSRRLIREDGDYAVALLARLQRCQDDDEATLIVCRMMSWLDTPEARQILGLRLRGMTHGAIAQAMDSTDTAIRKRWESIRVVLMQRIEQGELG
jgi:DNA-directed RNA polymerase specialized sigma24 family protein